MQAAFASAIDWFALPENGLSSIFVVAFLSATLLPLGSEPTVFGFVKLHPELFWATIAVAAAGNTLGGIVDYWLGYGAHEALARGRETRYWKWFRALGPKALFFAWLPAVGDPLCTVAGWLRMPFWPSVGWMALGKLMRYSLVTAALLRVPDDWWQAIVNLF